MGNSHWPDRARLRRDSRWRALQLGPLVAEDAEVATALAGRAFGGFEGPVCIDCPDAQTIFGNRLRRHGFAAERPLIRMLLGRARAFGEPEGIFAIAGPELG